MTYLGDIVRGSAYAANLGRMPSVRIMHVMGRWTGDGPSLEVGTLVRGLDPDLFEQRLYVGDAPPEDATDVDARVVPALGRPGRARDALRTLATLTAAMREFKPDLVHTHTGGALGRVAAALARVPVRVHTFHVSPAVTALAGRAERALAHRTNQLLAVSQRVLDDLVAARIGSRHRCGLVPLGVSLPAPPSRDEARRALGLPGTAPVVAFVGPVDQVKRPDRLLAVAREVRRALGDARLLVCGQGDLLAQTVSGAQGLGAEFLARRDVETVYAAADIALLTSDDEDLPVSLIEAAMCQRPAVAIDVGGVSEVVRHGHTGFVTDADVGRLSDAVIRLLRDHALRRWMGRQAAADAHRRFGSARLVDDATELYLRLVGSPTRALTAARP
jgi:glycosyltransferase involved in cell wall biosynthesis